VNQALRKTLAVEVADLLEEVVVLERRRETGTLPNAAATRS
jgi:hypothetical protein